MKGIDSSINVNICAECEDILKKVDPCLFDTGVCSKCGKLQDVIDPLLYDLYKGLGFSPEYVYRHLPRLRLYPNRMLSMVDIGVAISSPKVMPGIWREKDHKTGLVGLTGLVKLDTPATTPGMIVVAKASEAWKTKPELRFQVWPDGLELESSTK